ncbi:hypothetical protein ACAS46_002747 [Vibrio vulnificus]
MTYEEFKEYNYSTLELIEKRMMKAYEFDTDDELHAIYIHSSLYLCCLLDLHKEEYPEFAKRFREEKEEELEDES